MQEGSWGDLRVTALAKRRPVVWVGLMGIMALLALEAISGSCGDCSWEAGGRGQGRVVIVVVERWGMDPW